MKTKSKPKYGVVSEEGRQWMSDILAERQQFVSVLVHGGWDRVEAMLKWDQERSPRMTQGEALQRIGCIPTHRRARRDLRLKWMIEGLAQINVYLVGTNHLTDDQLMRRLEMVLSDEVNFIPPNDDMSEFIDFSARDEDTTPVCDRDSTLPKPPPR